MGYVAVFAVASAVVIGLTLYAAALAFCVAWYAIAAAASVVAAMVFAAAWALRKLRGASKRFTRAARRCI